MTKNDILDSFQLKEGEKVRLQENIIGRSKYVGFLFFIGFLWVGLIGAYMPLYFGRFDVFIICFIILELSFSIFGIKGWDGLNRQARYKLIISNERAIKFPRKSILPFNSKKEEFFF